VRHKRKEFARSSLWALMTVSIDYSDEKLCCIDRYRRNEASTSSRLTVPTSYSRHARCIRSELNRRLGDIMLPVRVAATAKLRSIYWLTTLNKELSNMRRCAHRLGSIETTYLSKGGTGARCRALCATITRDERKQLSDRGSYGHDKETRK
jgi:hypothetical protein